MDVRCNFFYFRGFVLIFACKFQIGANAIREREKLEPIPQSGRAGKRDHQSWFSGTYGDVPQIFVQLWT